MFRRVLPALAFAARVAKAQTASAFDFHEHAALAAGGARGRPDEARVAFRKALRELRRDRPFEAVLPLCDDPLASLGSGRIHRCVPYGSLTSLAADHHPTEATLLAALPTQQSRALID